MKQTHKPQDSGEAKLRFCEAKIMKDIYNVGIYCRLSRDDGNGESSSISSQKLMLTDYAKERNWHIYEYYCDAAVIIGLS